MHIYSVALIVMVLYVVISTANMYASVKVIYEQGGKKLDVAVATQAVSLFNTFLYICLTLISLVCYLATVSISTLGVVLLLGMIAVLVLVAIIEFRRLSAHCQNVWPWLKKAATIYWLRRYILDRNSKLTTKKQ